MVVSPSIRPHQELSRTVTMTVRWLFRLSWGVRCEGLGAAPLGDGGDGSARVGDVSIVTLAACDALAENRCENSPAVAECPQLALTGQTLGLEAGNFCYCQLRLRDPHVDQGFDLETIAPVRSDAGIVGDW